MGKIFWFDTETTGLDPQRNALIQIAGIIEVNGIVKERLELLVRPPKGTYIDKAALKVNKRTVEELMDFPDARVSLVGLKKTLGKYIDKFNKKDKFVPAGFNVNFDIGFLRQMFVRCGDKYYGSWFYNCPIDVWTLVGQAIAMRGLWLPNYKLTTCCDYFGIDIEHAHDAIDDIEATRMLYNRIKEELFGAEGTRIDPEPECSEVFEQLA